MTGVAETTKSKTVDKGVILYVIKCIQKQENDYQKSKFKGRERDIIEKGNTEYRRNRNVLNSTSHPIK